MELVTYTKSMKWMVKKKNEKYIVFTKKQLIGWRRILTWRQVALLTPIRETLSTIARDNVNM